MTRYFQTDDRDDYFASLGKNKDCTHKVFRVYKDGKQVLEGRDACAKICKVVFDMGKSQRKKTHCPTFLIKNGYTIKFKVWNVTRDKWETEDWEDYSVTIQ